MSTLVSHSLDFTSAQWKAVQRKARQHNQTPSEYLAYLVERALLAEQSFDEILRPIRKDVRASGVTPEQLDTLVNEARKATKGQRRR